jgi:hypothetical protein
MSGVGLPCWLGDVKICNNAELFGGGAACSATVTLIKNMPDAALHATKRKLGIMLDAVSTKLLAHLKFYSLPGVKRSKIAWEHRFYGKVGRVML